MESDRWTANVLFFTTNFGNNGGNINCGESPPTTISFEFVVGAVIAVAANSDMEVLLLFLFFVEDSISLCSRKAESAPCSMVGCVNTVRLAVLVMNYRSRVTDEAFKYRYERPMSRTDSLSRVERERINYVITCMFYIQFLFSIMMLTMMIQAPIQIFDLCDHSSFSSVIWHLGVVAIIPHRVCVVVSPG